MTEKRNTCPLCGNHLEPTDAEKSNDMFNVILLTIEAYKTAFEAACEVVRNNAFEYERLHEKLRNFIRKTMEINAKYIH